MMEMVGKVGSKMDGGGWVCWVAREWEGEWEIMGKNEREWGSVFLFRPK